MADKHSFVLPLDQKTQYSRDMNVTQIETLKYNICIGSLPADSTAAQIFLVSFVSLITATLLRPLRMPLMVSQMIAALLLSPTFLGKFYIMNKIIAPSDFLMLDTYASFGMIFQLFLAGVQTNPLVIIQGGKKAIVIAISVLLVPLSLGLTSGLVLSLMVPEGEEKVKSPASGLSAATVGVVESLTALPVIACYVSELKIQNSEFSRLAIAASMYCGMFLALIVFLVSTVLNYTANEDISGLVASLVGIALIMVIVVYLFKPAMRRMIKQVPEGKKVKEDHMRLVFLALLVIAAVTDTFSFYIMIGPFVFGMIVPPGPPLGSFLVETFQLFNTWMIMPVFYFSHARMIDLAFDSETLKNVIPVAIVILITCIGKFLGAFLPAIYYNMSYNDATLIGLTMNAQGFIEILVYKALKVYRMIEPDTFGIMYVSMVVITGGLTNLIRYIYKLSMEYKGHNMRTIQHLQQNSELRVLACVYKEENVAPVVHLLKATNPTKHSPINASMVHFVELAGHATPLVISHKLQRNMSSSSAVSHRIFNVFKQYEDTNKESISLHPYTVVSPYGTLHNDLFTIALQRGTSLVILPYHMQFTTGDSNANIKDVNCKLLEKSPCSVGILVDRGLLGGLKFVLANLPSYHVAVVFLGGADDREALALGARMSGHPTIELTVIHFRLVSSGDDKASDPIESDLDDEAICDFMIRTTYNDGVTYIEEEVKNGFDITKVIQSMNDRYEIILLGRRHDRNSTLIVELTEWEKCSELGTVADVFTESGYGGQATILVVQQKTNVAADSQIYDC